MGSTASSSDIQKMFSLRVQYLARLEPESIPRALNEKADRLRHIIDYNNRQFFADIEEAWGIHSVDCLDIFHNRQLPRFNS